MPEKPCPCGSKKPRYELVDAAGVFCCFICEDCLEKKKSSYNPKIFEQWYDPDKPEPRFPDDY